jgi:hypothetical protein
VVHTWSDTLIQEWDGLVEGLLSGGHRVLIESGTAKGLGVEETLEGAQDKRVEDSLHRPPFSFLFLLCFGFRCVVEARHQDDERKGLRFRPFPSSSLSSSFDERTEEKKKKKKRFCPLDQEVGGVCLGVGTEDSERLIKTGGVR